MLEEQLSEDARNILGLQLPTDPRWVDLAGKSIEEILTDHAYCEQKAATSCISLIQRYSEREKLVKELAPIVTEEWGHFRLVLQELEKRNLKLGKQRKDEYVNKLLEFQRKGGDVEDRFLDQLLVTPPEHFFCVSTDKAANPVNIMGASKKLMEEVILAYSGALPITTARIAIRCIILPPMPKRV